MKFIFDKIKASTFRLLLALGDGGDRQQPTTRKNINQIKIQKRGQIDSKIEKEINNNKKRTEDNRVYNRIDRKRALCCIFVHFVGQRLLHPLPTHSPSKRKKDIRKYE